MGWTRTFAAALAFLLLPAAAGAQAPIPDWRQLEAAGARIGSVRVVPQDVFDTSDPEEDNALFRWANRVHVETRPGVIERMLLFRSGDRVSVRVLEETERVLRANRFLADVDIRAVGWHDGVVDVEVRTRDSWSFDPGVSAGRTGGTNTGGIHVREYNLLGTGTSLGLGRAKSIDRTATEIQVSNPHVFGPWNGAALAHSDLSDGKRDVVVIEHPFYALDARWAAGVSAVRDDRVDALYDGDRTIAEYRHRALRGEAYAGWSPGLVDGWTQRYSLGVQVADDAYRQEPGRVPAPTLPRDERLAGPFVRWQVVQDRFQREINRNLIGRPEFYALGWQSTVQLGWAPKSSGATDGALLYGGVVSAGFEPDPDLTVIGAASIAGRYADGDVRRQRAHLESQAYLRQGPRWLFYASASADVLTRPDVPDQLLLGGDTGLRGYPVRYQSGTRKVLLTAEERFYTDIYLWRLFRIGGAAFVDAGRAWGGPYVNAGGTGWLADAGIGLRIVSVRSAFGNVLHIDLAQPLNGARDVRKVQVQVKTKSSF